MSRDDLGNFFFRFLALAAMAAFSSSSWSQNFHHPQVDFKLLFNQLFALEIKKDLPAPENRREKRQLEEKFARLLRQHTYYAPENFNEIVQKVAEGDTSNDIYENIDKVLGQERNRKLITKLNFKKSIPASLRKDPAIKEFLKGIKENSKRHYSPQENYFSSPEGKNMMKALSSGENQDGVVMVMVSGFGAHILKDFIFEEFPIMANQIHGRTRDRPLESESPLNLKYVGPEVYYKDGPANPEAKAFDILHPMGDELGNTMGPDALNAQALKAFIDKLPDVYQNKKFIFLTFSKGQPMILDFFKQNPEFSKKTLAIVSYAGVFQGTSYARIPFDAVKENFGIGREKVEEITAFLEKGDPQLKEFLSQCLPGNVGAFGNLGLAALAFIPQLEKILRKSGIDPDYLKSNLQRTLELNDVRQILLGIYALTPAFRAEENLKFLNNHTFPHPVAQFNLSAVTNVKDFTMAGELEKDGSRIPSPLVPTLNSEGKIDFEKFSLDASFLYYPSVLGFRSAPGGLYDTQVELSHTKSFFLDTRPLSESLTKEELHYLWEKRLEDKVLAEIFTKNGIDSLDILMQTPRKDLIKPENRDNFESIDLGEIRGHHWSSLVQALKPPSFISEKHHQWTFPRLSYMRALMQTIALYHLINEASAEKGEQK